MGCRLECDCGDLVKSVLFLLALPPPRKTRAELMKAIDFEYYGYLDEDDGVIVPLEQDYEKKCRSMNNSFHYRWHLVSILSLENGFVNSAICQKRVYVLLMVFRSRGLLMTEPSINYDAIWGCVGPEAADGGSPRATSDLFPTHP